MKKIVYFIALLFSLNGLGQTYITKDTTFLGYLARVSYISGNTDSTVCILTMLGNGEVGTTVNNSQVYGPHYWFNHGFTGAVVLGNGTHYPVYVTLQQPATYTRPWVLKPKIDAIIQRFKVKSGCLAATGLSGGAWCWQQVATYKPTAADTSYFSIFRAIVNIQGVRADDTYDATLPYPRKFGNAARIGGFRYAGFEQVLDNRGISDVVKSIIDSAGAGRGYMYWTNFGSSGHSNFNDFYDPSQNNWTLTNPDVQVSNGGALNTTPFAGNQNIYQWILRQFRDTTLTPAVAPSASAGAPQTIYLPTTTVTLSGAASGGVAPYTYLWTKTSGSGGTITSPTSLSTTVTGLSVGTYTFNLAVTDQQPLTGNNGVTITVKYSNGDLVVTSNNQTITAGNNASLTSSYSTSFNVLTTNWTKLSSPASVALKIVAIGSSSLAGVGSTGYTSGGVNDSSYFTRFCKWGQANNLISTYSNLAQSTTDIFDGQPSWYVPQNGGQRPPLAGRNITAALALNPDIIFCSYPTNSYDYLSVTEIMAAYRRIKATVDSAGKIIFFGTTQPRTTFSPSEELKLIEIRDSIIAQFPNNYVELYKVLEDPDNPQFFKTELSYNDGIHFNDFGHRQIFYSLMATNFFKSLVANAGTITTPTAQNTTISGLSAGTYRYQISIKDSRYYYSSSVSTVTVNPSSSGTCNPNSPVTYNLTPTGSPGSWEIYITNASGQPWKGGDTLKVPAGTYSVIEIDSFGGDNCRPIIIQNSGGLVKVNGPMRFGKDVHYVSILGKDSAGITYGFKCYSFAFGRVNHWTMKRIWVDSAYQGVGIYGKQDPYVDQPWTQYPNYTINKITIDSCKVTNVAGEAMYIGHTYPDGDPANSFLIPQRLDSVTISNCIVDSSGWDGIQLSNARNGNLIYNNTVSNFGLADIDGQRAGIISGGNTNTQVYNNTVSNGKGNGLEFFGYGTMECYGNTVTNVGSTSKSLQGEESIYGMAYVNAVETNPRQAMVIHDNQINYPMAKGAIRFWTNNNSVTPNLYNNNFCFLTTPAPDWKTQYIAIDMAYTDVNNVLSCVGDPDAPPVAHAGNDTTVFYPSTTTVGLFGSVTDPDGTASAYSWIKLSGPTGGTIASPSSLVTSASGLVPGTYIFRLTVTGNPGVSSFSDKTVTVNVNTTNPQRGYQGVKLFGH